MNQYNVLLLSHPLHRNKPIINRIVPGLSPRNNLMDFRYTIPLKQPFQLFYPFSKADNYNTANIIMIFKMF